MSAEPVDAAPVGTAVLRAALPAACAATVEALIACRSGRAVDLDGLAARLGCEPCDALDAAQVAEDAFRRVFGLTLIAPGVSHGSDAGRAVVDGTAGRIRLARGFVDLLERAPAAAPRVEEAPEVSGDALHWIAALAAPPEVRRSGLHLGLRADGDGSRAFADVTALLADVGVTAVEALGEDDDLACSLLRADLHVGPTRSVVLVRAGLLEDEEAYSDYDFVATGRAPGSPSAFVTAAFRWLVAMRATCLWLIPTDAAVPAALDGLVAGCVGPLVPDPGWSRAAVSAALGGKVSAASVEAIASTVGDPRDAGPRAGAARLLAAGGTDVDAACRIVARSLVPSPPASAVLETFDLGLVAHHDEVALVLARAREVASAGGRVIFYGPPGGGKSSLARAIAARMEASGEAGPPVVVTAASILVRPLGGTERLLDRLWRRAEAARSPLVVDELDAMCGARDASDGSGGNAYLVRMLTDEWIRQLDAHPAVPVLATVNDLRAVDPAIMRRFHAHYAIGDGLPPHLERRAWASILGMDPPPRWKPCGASPADFASAKVRCRMLGLWDADSLADAVRRAREARRSAPAEPVARERIH